METNQLLLSAIAQHGLYLVQLGNGQAATIIPLLEKLGLFASKEIQSYGDRLVRKKDYTELIRALTSRYDADLAAWINELVDSLEPIAQQEIEFATEALDAVVEVPKWTAVSVEVDDAIRASMLTAMVLNSKAQTVKSMLDGFKRSQVEQMQAYVLAGFTQGAGTAAIAKQIRDEQLTRTLRDARAVTHTLYTHTATVTKSKVYKANSDLVVGYELVAVLDRRTTQICRAFDGRQVKFTDDYQPHPPFHVACRTTEVPLLDERYRIDDKNARRASSGASGGKQVSADLSYYDWLKTQPAWFQDDAIGKKYADIFRNSGLSAEEFRRATVDKLGQPLTILEMAEKNAKIAEYLRTTNNEAR